jgi:hypothetical protein
MFALTNTSVRTKEHNISGVRTPTHHRHEQQRNEGAGEVFFGANTKKVFLGANTWKVFFGANTRKMLLIL